MKVYIYSWYGNDLDKMNLPAKKISSISSMAGIYRIQSLGKFLKDWNICCMVEVSNNVEYEYRIYVTSNGRFGQR